MQDLANRHRLVTAEVTPMVVMCTQAIWKRFQAKTPLHSRCKHNYARLIRGGYATAQMLKRKRHAMHSIPDLSIFQIMALYYHDIEEISLFLHSPHTHCAVVACRDNSLFIALPATVESGTPCDVVDFVGSMAHLQCC